VNIELGFHRLQGHYPIFDERNKRWEYSLLSATGVVGNTASIDLEEGLVFLPTYNLTRIRFEELQPFFAAFELNVCPFAPTSAPNFVWIPFSLRQYRIAHAPFAQAFAERHGVELDAVLLIIAALCVRVFYMWKEVNHSLLRFFQRAYEGPYRFEDVLAGIRPFIPAAMHLLKVDDRTLEKMALSKAMQFWKLDDSKRSELDLAYSGPHSVFLPYDKQHVFIDYPWIHRRLYDLFVGVSIPDQNFKGEALERLVQFKSSALPTGQCKARDGTAKQIDAAFAVGDRLIIVECRATGKSIGFDRGDPNAIQYRIGIIDRALNDVDKKADWLIRHPVGANYDITRFKDILPVAVTPFAEFIPSLGPQYWLKEGLPRVLTPLELRAALQDGTLASTSANVLSLIAGQ